MNPSQTPAALNLNPLNLRPLSGGQMWAGQIGISTYAASGSFAKFATVEDGIAAAVQNLRSYARAGFHTLERVIYRWAPPNDPHMPNHTEAYLKSVCDFAGVDRTYSIAWIGTPGREDDDIDMLARIICGMNRVEAGGATITEEQAKRGIIKRLGYSVEKKPPEGYVRNDDGNIMRPKAGDSTIIRDSNRGAVAGTIAAGAAAAPAVLTGVGGLDPTAQIILLSAAAVVAVAAGIATAIYFLKIKKRRKKMWQEGVA